MNSSLDSASERARLTSLVALGAAQLTLYGILATWEGYQTRPHIAMLLALAAFAFYATALFTTRDLSGSGALLVAAGFGLAFRATLFPETPFLSDDYVRYLWDGIVQLDGLNPYRHAPADPALAGIDDALRARVNHPEVRTIYPPLAQLVFLAAAKISAGNVLILKAAWMACDLGIAVLLYRLAPVRRRLSMWMLYWWSPLVVVEVYWNAHLDLLGVGFVVVLLTLARQISITSTRIGAAIAAASLIKYFAVAFLPSAIRSGRSLRVAAGFGLAIALLSAPYTSSGVANMFEGLLTYAQHWRFHAGLYRALEWALVSPTLAKAMASAVVLLVVGNSVRNRWSIERTVFWITGATLMLSPTVHPWYLLWMVPLLTVRPNRGWTYLTGSIFFAYFGLDTYRAAGVWPEPWWVVLMIYGPFFALLLTDAWRGSWWQTAREAIRIGPEPRDDGSADRPIQPR